jgi:uncharacterized protein YecA (UPF0149 family)
MQEFRPTPLTSPGLLEALEDMPRVTQKFFTAKSEEEMQRKLRASQSEEEARGMVMTKEVRCGRNKPCPCGSGVKFKKCHGRCLV